MNSPITGKPMVRLHERRTLSFRKEDFEIDFLYWFCADSGEKFEDEAMSDANFNQVQNQYRAKHNLPFADEIKQIRQQYGVSAKKMSLILGFGDNQYRQYEADEMPSISNGRLIMQASEPTNFLQCVRAAESELGADEARLLIKTIEEKNKIPQLNRLENLFEKTSTLNGYRRFSTLRLWNMVIFFAENSQPFKTKLNKLLFYADFAAFRDSGRSISGAVYRAIQHGPVPNDFNRNFAEGVYNGVLDVETEPVFDYNAERYFGKVPFQKDLFAEAEIETMTKVADIFSKKNNAAIIETSHLEKAWLDCNADKSLIDYRYAFDLLAI